jgi:hypothetical protein
MRITLLLITLGLILTSCSRRAQISGAWRDKSGAVALIFNRNDSFMPGGDTNQCAGTWQIHDEMIMLTLTNAITPHSGVKVGDTVQFRIVQVDSKQLLLRLGGQTISLRR